MKLFKTEMSISKTITQMTLAGLLVALASIMELFAMVKFGKASICFGFFVVLLFPLLLEYRISVIAALISVTITEFAISAEGDYWVQYASIFLAFPVIKALMIFDKKWLFVIGLIIGVSIYLGIMVLEQYFLQGAALATTFIIAKVIQMFVAVPIAIALYYPIKRVMPKSLDNSWEKKPCCGNCTPSVNGEQRCCSDACTDGCKDK